MCYILAYSVDSSRVFDEFNILIRACSTRSIIPAFAAVSWRKEEKFSTVSEKKTKMKPCLCRFGTASLYNSKYFAYNWVFFDNILFVYQHAVTSRMTSASAVGKSRRKLRFVNENLLNASRDFYKTQRGQSKQTSLCVRKITCFSAGLRLLILLLQCVYWMFHFFLDTV